MTKPEPELLPATSTAVAEYSDTARGLAELRQQLEGASFDCTTTEGDKLARQSRRALVSLRTSLEEKRKELKAPLLERGRLIDDEAKRITAEIVKLEDPIDAVIKAEEARRQAIKDEEERIERERQQKNEDAIARITNLPMEYLGATSDTLASKVTGLHSINVDEAFDEDYRGLAAQAIGDAKTRLQGMLDSALKAEQQEAELAQEREARAREQQEAQAREAELRAQQERQEAQRAAKARQDAVIEKGIQRIRGTALEFVGATSQLIAGAITHLENEPITEGVYGDRVPEAEAARAGAIAKLREMHAARVQHEADQAALRQQREEAEQREAERLAAEQAERERQDAERREQERKDREARQREAAEREALELANVTLREAAEAALALIVSEWGEDAPVAKKLAAALSREQPAKKRASRARKAVGS